MTLVAIPWARVLAGVRSERLHPPARNGCRRGGTDHRLAVGLLAVSVSVLAVGVAGCGSNITSAGGRQSAGFSHSSTASGRSSSNGSSITSTPATPARAAPTWVELPNSNAVNNQNNGVALLIESSAGPLDVYALRPGGFSTQIAPSIPGAQIAPTKTFAVLSTPSKGYPYGTVIVVASGTIPQHQLHPAARVEVLQVYDPQTGRRLSSIPLRLPVFASMFQPEYGSATVISGILTEQSPSGQTTSVLPAGFSLADAHLLWIRQPVPASAGEQSGVLFVYPDNSGQVGFPGGASGTYESSCQLEGIDATTGKLLYTLSTATFGTTEASKCFNQQSQVFPFGPTVTSVTYAIFAQNTGGTGCGSWLFDTRTGRVLPTPTVLQDACNDYVDDITGLVAVQGLGNSTFVNEPDGPVVDFLPGRPGLVLTVSQQTVAGVGFSLVAACDGQLLGTTSSQDLAVNEVSGKTRSLSWNAAPAVCGHGWALAEGSASSGNSAQYLYRGAPPVLQELFSEP